MDTASCIVQSASAFYETVKEGTFSRYLSWEHCYTAFYHARSKEQLTDEYIDYLSLHLSFYLASWGMYRGSSFLLQKDYRIHIPAVKEILKPEYDNLLGISCENILKDENQKLLIQLGQKLEDYYNPVRISVSKETPKNKLSNTLITKILMGALGCVPAYDRYFIYGVKKFGVTTGNYNPNSLTKLAQFYQENSSTLDLACNKMNINDIPYPQMKFLDMGFWQIGFQDGAKQ